MEQDVSKQIEDVEMADLAPVVSSAYSASNLAQNVDNIDKDDVENPQLVVEYVNEIYHYLRQLEVLQGIIFNKLVAIILELIRIIIFSLFLLHMPI